MTATSFFTFLLIVCSLAVPPLYPMPCPTCHGTGTISVVTSGMESVRLDDFSAKVVNVIRLGCALYAVYTVDVNLTFSNSARASVNASVVVGSKDKFTGRAYDKYVLTYALPANVSGYVVSETIPAKMYVGSNITLPTLSFWAELFEASNISVDEPCPTCLGHGTVSFLRWCRLTYFHYTAGGI